MKLNARTLWFVSCQFPATPFCKLQQIKEILCIFTKCQNNLPFIFLNEYITFRPESFTCIQISKNIFCPKNVALRKLHFFVRPTCILIQFTELGMGRTYAKFLFSTADFQVKFYAGRFCAKIFLSSLQSHWLSRIFYANGALSISKYNMISCEESHVCGNWASRQSCVGKKLCCFPRFSYFFRSSDSNAADICFVVPLRTALRAITCDKHCINRPLAASVTTVVKDLRGGQPSA